MPLPTDFTKWDISTHQIVELVDDWNTLIDHGITKQPVFTIKIDDEDSDYYQCTDAEGHLVSRDSDFSTVFNYATTNATSAGLIEIGEGIFEGTGTLLNPNGADIKCSGRNGTTIKINNTTAIGFYTINSFKMSGFTLDMTYNSVLGIDVTDCKNSNICEFDAVNIPSGANVILYYGIGTGTHPHVISDYGWYKSQNNRLSDFHFYTASSVAYYGIKIRDSFHCKIENGDITNAGVAIQFDTPHDWAECNIMENLEIKNPSSVGIQFINSTNNRSNGEGSYSNTIFRNISIDLSTANSKGIEGYDSESYEEGSGLNIQIYRSTFDNVIIWINAAGTSAGNGGLGTVCCDFGCKMDRTKLDGIFLESFVDCTVSGNTVSGIVLRQVKERVENIWVDARGSQTWIQPPIFYESQGVNKGFTYKFLDLSFIKSNGNYSLMSADANSGQKVVNVEDGTEFTEGSTVVIYDTATAENNIIDDITGNQLTMYFNLSNTYSAGDSIGPPPQRQATVANVTDTEQMTFYGNEIDSTKLIFNTLRTYTSPSPYDSDVAKLGWDLRPRMVIDRNDSEAWKLVDDDFIKQISYDLTNKELKFERGQNLTMYSDGGNTQKIKLNGTTGDITCTSISGIVGSNEFDNDIVIKSTHSGTHSHDLFVYSDNKTTLTARIWGNSGGADFAGNVTTKGNLSVYDGTTLKVELGTNALGYSRFYEDLQLRSSKNLISYSDDGSTQKFKVTGSTGTIDSEGQLNTKDNISVYWGSTLMAQLGGGELGYSTFNHNIRSINGKSIYLYSDNALTKKIRLNGSNGDIECVTINGLPPPSPAETLYLQVPPDYTIRINGGKFESYKSSDNTLAFGGSGNAGGVSGDSANAVIQATVNALPTGHIHIKQGIYPDLEIIITDKIIRFTGAGIGITYLSPLANHSTLTFYHNGIKQTDFWYGFVEDLSIYGTASNTAGIEYHRMAFCVTRNVEISVNGPAFYVYGGHQNKFYNCRAYTNSGQNLCTIGFYVGGESDYEWDGELETDMWFIDCLAEYCSIGYYMDDSANGFMIMGCGAGENDTGYYFVGNWSGGWMINSWSDQSIDYGIVIENSIYHTSAQMQLSNVWSQGSGIRNLSIKGTATYPVWALQIDNAQLSGAGDSCVYMEGNITEGRFNFIAVGGNEDNHTGEEATCLLLKNFGGANIFSNCIIGYTNGTNHKENIRIIMDNNADRWTIVKFNDCIIDDADGDKCCFGLKNTSATHLIQVFADDITLLAGSGTSRYYNIDSSSTGAIDFNGPNTFNEDYNGNLVLTSNVYDLTQQNVIDAMYKWQNGIWQPVGFTLPASYLRFKDSETLGFTDLFMINIDNFVEEPEPMIVTNQGLLVKKDIDAGGFLGSLQGALMLGHGLTSQLDMPKILLTSSSVAKLDNIASGTSFPISPEPVDGQLFIRSDLNHLYSHNGATWDDLGTTASWAGYFDILYITKVDGTTPAGLSCGNINPTTSNTYSLGSPTYSWQGLVAYTIYANAYKNKAGTSTWIDDDGDVIVKSVTTTGVIQGCSSGGPANAFFVGNDAYIADVNLDGFFGIKGYVDSTKGGIVFGSDGDTNIYRGSGGNLLQTDDKFQTVKLLVKAGWGSWAATNYALQLYRNSAVNDSQYIDFANGVANDVYLGRKQNDDSLYISYYNGSITDMFKLTTTGLTLYNDQLILKDGVHGLSLGAAAGTIWSKLVSTSTDTQLYFPTAGELNLKLIDGSIMFTLDHHGKINTHGELASGGMLSFTNALTARTKAYILPYFYSWNGTEWHPYHFDGTNHHYPTYPTSPEPTSQIPTNCIKFVDDTSHQSNYLFITHIVDVATDDNLLCWDNGMIVQKDFTAGGFLAANQGVLALGHGMNSYNDKPRVWLLNSGTVDPDGGYFDTLYVTKFNGTTLGHIKVDDVKCTTINGLTPMSGSWTAVPSNIIPSANNTYNLGSSSYKWANIYATNGYFYGTNPSIMCEGGVPAISLKTTQTGTREWRLAGSFDSVTSISLIDITNSNYQLAVFDSNQGGSSPFMKVNGYVNPWTNNTFGLGTTSNRWGDVVATTAHINNLDDIDAGSITSWASINPYYTNLGLGSGGNPWGGVVTKTVNTTFYASAYATVQDAIEACHTAGGGTVIIGAGTYHQPSYGTPVAYTKDYSDIVLDGEGSFTILEQTDGAAPVIKIGNTGSPYHVQVKNLTARFATGITASYDNIDGKGLYNVIENVMYENVAPSRYGVYLHSFLYWYCAQVIGNNGCGGGFHLKSVGGDIIGKSGNSTFVACSPKDISKINSASAWYFDGVDEKVNIIDIVGSVMLVQNTGYFASNNNMIRVINSEFINFYGGFMEYWNNSSYIPIYTDTNSRFINFYGMNMYNYQSSTIDINGTHTKFFGGWLSGAVMYSDSKTNLLSGCEEYSLGSGTYWNETPNASGDYKFDGNVIVNGNLVQSNFNPYSNGTYSLGSGNNAWLGLSISGNSNLSGIYLSPYFAIQSFYRTYTEYNCLMTHNSGDGGYSEEYFTPRYYGGGDSNNSMGYWRVDAARADLEYKYYNHGTSGSEVPNSSFTSLFKLLTSGTLELPVEGSGAGLLLHDNVRLYASGNVLYCTNSIYPSSSESFALGSPTLKWDSLSVMHIYYSTMATWDEVDDLSLLKGIKSVYHPTLKNNDGTPKLVADPESISFLKKYNQDGQDELDLYSTVGFTLSSVKKIVEQEEKHTKDTDEKILILMDEIELLKSEIKKLKSKP